MNLHYKGIKISRLKKKSCKWLQRHGVGSFFIIELTLLFSTASKRHACVCWKLTERIIHHHSKVRSEDSSSLQFRYSSFTTSVTMPYTFHHLKHQDCLERWASLRPLDDFIFAVCHSVEHAIMASAFALSSRTLIAVFTSSSASTTINFCFWSSFQPFRCHCLRF